MTAFKQPFLFLRNPAGGVENLSDMKAAGFAGVFCNVIDYPLSSWEQVVLPRARSLGMFCGPWGRTGHPPPTGIGFEVAKVDRIIAAADLWASPLVLNCEKEIDGSGDALTKLIAQKVGSRDAALSVEARPFASVQWTPVAHLPVLPQIFPAESAASKDPAACKQAWHAYGVRCVYFTFGTYGGMKPADFELKAPYSLYTADDIEGGPAAYRNWSPTSSGFVGCVQPSPPFAQSTAQTREAIVAAAEAWEAGQGGPKPLTRITLSKRIASGEIKDRDWKPYGEAIASILDAQE